MIETTNVTIRIERDLKERADKLFNDLGINFSTAVKIFIKQCLREGKIPFRISMNSDNNDDVLLGLMGLFIDCYSGDINNLILLRNKLDETIKDSSSESLSR